MQDNEEIKTKVAKSSTTPEASKLQRGDTVVWRNTSYSVVEILEEGRWHIKNVNAPFNSCIVTANDLTNNTEATTDAPTEDDGGWIDDKVDSL